MSSVGHVVDDDLTSGMTDGVADLVAIIITSGVANDELVTSVIDYV